MVYDYILKSVRSRRELVKKLFENIFQIIGICTMIGAKENGVIVVLVHLQRTEIEINEVRVRK